MTQIGIDLGTTNTVVSLDERVLAIGDNGTTLLPSVVNFSPSGTVLVGEVAKRRRLIDGLNTVFSSKRIIGRRFDHSITSAFNERYPFEVVDAGNDWPAFKTRGGIHTPTEIASLILGSVQNQIDPLLSEPKVVITDPTAFTGEKHEATRRAAEMTGFENVAILDESSATAWAYRYDPDVTGLVAIYDLGGGTLDVSVLDMDGAAPRMLAGTSEPFLGGDDIDTAIAHWVAQEVLKQHNWDLTNYSEVAVRLINECERVKVRLSKESETHVELFEVDPECPLAQDGLPISRAVMNRLASDLVRRSFILCDEVLQMAAVHPGDLRAVLLAGGGSQLPLVQEGVEAYFGRAGLCSINPTEVVAVGASISEV
jgi:molecular chaperone DnaK